MSETPGWTDYIIDTGSPECGTWLEESGMHLGGLRIMHLGAGRVALDDEAVERLQRLSDDSDGVIDQDGEDGGLLMWIGGCAYPVSPANA